MSDCGHRTISNRLVALLIVVVVLLLVQSVWVYGPALLSRPDGEPRPITPRGDLAEDEKSTVELFSAARRSVVYITTKSVRRGPFSFNLLEIPSGTGSGFMWGKHGHVVTNYHVIQGADSAQVTLDDKTTWNASVVGVAPSQDLAVLQITPGRAKLRPIPLGTSHDLQVGQKVFAIGNPFGLDRTLTTGVISGLGRELKAPDGRQIGDLIQTDAAINPGNSGGPLLDSAGRLIGVNTAIVSPSGAYAGVGFAVPADEVNDVVPQLIAHGGVTRPGLGVILYPQQFADGWRIDGVIVHSVIENGAADKAGIRPTQRGADGRIRLGDVIVAVDGKEVGDRKALTAILDRHEVGDEVTVKVQRPDGEHELAVRLQALPP